MDALRANDLKRTREVPVDERARRTIAAMREGIKLKRIALRHRFAALDNDEPHEIIEERLRRWLKRDE
jgi:hypothetical protein